MGAIDRVINWFVGAAPPQAGFVAPAPGAQPLREAFGVTIDADEDQWRPLTGDTNRDLTPLTQARMQKIAAFMWERNPLANRLIELVTAYLLGEGVKLTCKNEDGQALLRKFWRDPINKLGQKLAAMVRECELYGEQCYPVFVNEQTGFVRLGYLDPSLIETVVMDPDNPSQPIGVVTVKDKRGRARRYRVLCVGAPDAELFTSRTQQIRAGFTDGDCFYHRQNYLLGGTRGRSAILAQIDWLDGYDEFLFGELDRARDLRSYFYDVTITNATPEEVEARAKKISPPEPRSVRVHNDAEKWAVESPDLGAGESDTLSKLFRNHVLGGSTIPEHWFGSGGDVNRATAGEMGEPTFKVMTLKQQGWKHFLEEIGRYVLEQAKERGALKGYDPESEDWTVEAIFPELTARDTTKYAAALQQVAAACVVMMDKGLLSEATAVRILSAIAGRLGVELDVEAELQAAKKEADERRAKAMDEYGNPAMPPDGNDPTLPNDRSARGPGGARAPSQGADQ